MGDYGGFSFSLDIATLTGARSMQMVMSSILYAPLISFTCSDFLNFSSNPYIRKYFIIYSPYLVFNHPLGTA